MLPASYSNSIRECMEIHKIKAKITDSNPQNINQNDRFSPIGFYSFGFSSSNYSSQMSRQNSGQNSSSYNIYNRGGLHNISPL